MHTKPNKWNQNVINFLVREKFVNFLINIIHIIYMYVYKSFSTMIDKGFRQNIKKKEEMEMLENIN